MSEQMEPSFQDSLTDFDLDFLGHDSKTKLIQNRSLRRSSVLYLKKKVLLTDTVLNKYNTTKDQLDQTLSALKSTEQLNLQSLEKYAASEDKCRILEKDVEELGIQNKLLQEKCFSAENQYGGLMSHIKQLQLLVAEYETRIDSLKTENKLDKEKAKTSEKKVSCIQNENKTLTTHLHMLRDVIQRKRKNDKSIKNILRKYKDNKNDASEEECSDNDNFNDGDMSMCYSEDSSEALNNQVKSPKAPGNEFVQETDKNLEKRLGSIDSESIDIRSVDTGRGSSLAFSDGEKSFHSPDYYMNDSPLSTLTIINDKKVVRDSATSPVLIRTLSVGTNTVPVNEKSEAIKKISVSTSTNVETFNKTTNTINEGTLDNTCLVPANKSSIGTNTLPLSELLAKTIEIPIIQKSVGTNTDATNKTSVCTSPIPKSRRTIGTNPHLYDNTADKIKTIERGVSPIKVVECIRKSPNTVVLKKSLKDVAVNTTPQKSTNIEEKECLEINNSVNLIDNCQNDSEIEMILDKMKLHHRLITPIPATPVVRNSRQGIRTTINCEDNLYDLSCPSLAMSKKLDAVFNMVISIHERLPQLFSDKDGILLDKCKYDKSSKNQHKQSKEDGYYMNDNQNYDERTSVIEQAEESNRNVNEDVQQFTEDQTLSQETDNIEDEDDDTFVNSDNYLASPSHCTKDSDQLVDSTKLLNTSVIEKDNINQKRMCKRRRPTKLDKFRKTLMPRSKIKRFVLLKKSKLKNRKFISLKKLNNTGAKPGLNHKAAFDKAVKIVAELKEQNKWNRIPTVVVEDCLKVGMQRNKETAQNEIDHGYNIDLTSKPEFERETINPSTNTNDINNSTQCSEIRKPVKRVSVDELVQVETKRILRPRRPSKSEVSVDIKSPIAINNNDKNKTNSSNTMSEPVIANTKTDNTSSKRKRRSTSCRQSLDEIPNCDTNPDENDLEKSRPAKSPLINIDEGINHPQTPCKRLLRNNSKNDEGTKMISSSISLDNVINVNNTPSKFHTKEDSLSNHSNRRISRCTRPSVVNNKSENAKTKYIEPETNTVLKELSKETVCNTDLDVFNGEPNKDVSNSLNNDEQDVNIPQTEFKPNESLLCVMIEKYALRTVRYLPKKVSEPATEKIRNKLEQDINNMNKLKPHEIKNAMVQLLSEIKHWDLKEFIVGFMKFLQDPNRKAELFNKICSPPAPPMTKTEQVFIYIIDQLRYHWNGDLTHEILSNIEFTLFNFNKTPDFSMVESMSHFYAILCRYYKLKSKLRMFLLDAMYCIQYKAVPLIKQCLEVWMHVLPLAHMGLAKTPLVTCLVYLLHFYKCEDKTNRVGEIRFILSRKYFYDFRDWNETRILDMIRTSIKDLRDIPIENKMLRVALIIISKRQGARWCLKNIIKGMLQPIIETEDVPSRVKAFCLSVLGPLMKPFPNDMKVHIEIVINKLMDMLENTLPQEINEGIISSLIYLNKHNQARLNQFLLDWNPDTLSPEFEIVLRDYVKSRPLKAWKTVLRYL